MHNAAIVGAILVGAMSFGAFAAGGTTAASVLTGCSARSEAYDVGVANSQAISLQGQVAILDSAAERVVFLGVDGEKDKVSLTRKSVRVGKNIISASASADGKSLFVVTAGAEKLEKPDDEGPALSILDHEGVRSRLPLGSALSGLAVDPKGKWLAVFPRNDVGAFIQNPNQLILVDLLAPGQPRAYPRTIRSFGGKPQRLTFTNELSLPLERTSLLVVETEQDVTLLDLNHVPEGRPEITVRLTGGDNVTRPSPSGIAVDDGDPARNDDARIAIRLGNDKSVVVLTLGPVDKDKAGPNSFAPIVNLVDVGGVATDLAFLQTDGGLRLAAIVPSRRRAILIDLASSATQPVDFPDAYKSVSIVTGQVQSAGNSDPVPRPPTGATPDTALLFGGSNSVAFWQLGRTTGRPYRSLETIAIATGAEKVSAVPAPNANLRILSSSSDSFYVLNLNDRTASPLTSRGSAGLYVSPSGKRFWAYGGSNLALLPLDGLSPQTMPVPRQVDQLVEIQNGNVQALVALHKNAAWGASIVDANTPDARNLKTTYGLLLENLPEIESR
jgi:hypothetical protein